MKMTISPEPALLGFLRSGPIHGYELYKRVTEELAPVWYIGLSQLYAIVNDYASRGWIRTRVESQGLRPSKKMLELTPAGRKAFDAWMTQPAHGLREFRVDFFARLYFARTLGRAGIDHLIDQQIGECHRELAGLESRQPGPLKVDDEFRRAVRQFRIEQLQTAIHWLERSRDELASNHKTRRANPLAARRAIKK